MTGLLRSRPTSWKIFLPHNSLIICFVIPEPARYMFSALLLSHKSKDLLFLMAPDFFSSTCNCRSGGYRTISILPLPAFLSSSFFPTARDFFPSFCPLCLLGICVFLHLIRIYHAFSNLHRSFSSFPSAFFFFPAHSIPLSYLLLPRNTCWQDSGADSMSGHRRKFKLKMMHITSPKR